MPYREIRPRAEGDRGEGPSHGDQESGMIDMTKEEAKRAANKRYFGTEKGRKAREEASKRYQETPKHQEKNQRKNDARKLNKQVEEEYGQSRMDTTLTKEQRSKLRKSAAPDRTPGGTPGREGVLLPVYSGKYIAGFVRATPEKVARDAEMLLQREQPEYERDRLEAMRGEQRGTPESDDREDKRYNN
jgi:hypothetical protein